MTSFVAAKAGEGSKVAVAPMRRASVKKLRRDAAASSDDVVDVRQVGDDGVTNAKQAAGNRARTAKDFMVDNLVASICFDNRLEEGKCDDDGYEHH
jgi:hypothetical protein